MGEWKYSSTHSLPMALHGGEWSAHTGCIIPGERSVVPTEEEAGWAPESVWIILRSEKSFVPARNMYPVPWSSIPYLLYCYQQYLFTFPFTVKMFHSLCEILHVSNNILKNENIILLKIAPSVYNWILITEIVKYKNNSVITIIDFLLCY